LCIRPILSVSLAIANHAELLSAAVLWVASDLTRSDAEQRARTIIAGAQNGTSGVLAVRKHSQRWPA
jgi:hypothetical protein